jgi:hypothetical protein
MIDQNGDCHTFVVLDCILTAAKALRDNATAGAFVPVCLENGKQFFIECSMTLPSIDVISITVPYRKIRFTGPNTIPESNIIIPTHLYS